MTQTMIGDLVARALAEDVGDGDVTTAATVPADARARATITQKAPGVGIGLHAAEQTFRSLDPELAIERLVDEGVWRDGGAGAGDRVQCPRDPDGGADRAELPAATVGRRHAHCPLRCGGAGNRRHRSSTCARRRRGFRALEKAAVAAGGGTNHRAGLYDAILIKENHSALAGGVGAAVRRASELAPELELEVECPTLAEVDEALQAGAPADPARQHGHRSAARGGGLRGRPRRARSEWWPHHGDARGSGEHRS